MSWKIQSILQKYGESFKKLEIISIVTNSFLLISLIYTFLIASPKYEASTQVLVNEKEKSDNMQAQQVQSNIQLVNTYSEIVKSPRILDEVAKEHKEYSSSQLNKMVSVNTEAQSQILNISVKENSPKNQNSLRMM